MFTIFNYLYNEAEDIRFNTPAEAAAYIFTTLPSDDFPFMIGDDTGIVAFAFQGNVYPIAVMAMFNGVI